MLLFAVSFVLAVPIILIPALTKVFIDDVLVRSSADETVLLVDAGNSAEGKIEIIEVRNAVKASAHHVCYFFKALFVHPVGQAVA